VLLNKEADRTILPSFRDCCNGFDVSINSVFYILIRFYWIV